MRYQGTTWIVGWALMLAAGPAAAGAGAGGGLAEIGSRTQLFVDDYMIQHLSHARQVLNPAQKHPNNPLIASDRPWEGHYLGLSRVYYDEEEGVFKMWYRSNNDFKVKKGADITDYKWTDEGRGSRKGLVAGELRFPRQLQRRRVAHLFRHPRGTA